MKPKRYFFTQPSLFHAPLRCGVPLVLGFVVFITGLDADAGDILRGGAGGGGGGKPRPGAQGGTPTPAATDAARANARDMLARTNRTLDAMRAMQNAARNAAGKGANNLGKNPLNPTITLPRVPNGLVTGGLKVSPLATTDPSKWSGAKLPKQTVDKGKTKVTIKQTEQQALLHWETFNVGKDTTVTFDQSKGGENVGQWIAFNKVSDPSANPTQILGDIKADGQVYLINPNGVIFGGSSQVNARGLTVSSLPINDNLVNQGLLNNRDAQFLFSGLKVPGGSDGTPDFNPEPPPAGGRFGDIIVQQGAVLKSPSDGAGNGGRIMLAGPNVTNHGTISTEAGQTVLAAGLQIGIAAHDSSDPSLRGLDVWVGDVGDYGGTVINGGLIDVRIGNALLTGKSIHQGGVIDSTTTVNLNGRIDLNASYGAVANPNFDNSTSPGAGGPMFLYQNTGTVVLGEDSVTRILPDYSSKRTVPGTELPERSRVNLTGQDLDFNEGSDLWAPNAIANIAAGSYTYNDPDGNNTILDSNGQAEAGITNHYTGRVQRFFFDNGQIRLSPGATISVAGSVDVFVPAAQNLLTVELRGAELADSPLQRDSTVRGIPMTVDLRQSGTYAGRFWQGTPLGDVTGLAGLIQRNAAQLTVNGGDLTLRAGGSVVVSQGAVVDVSGGYLRNEGGSLKTSSLISGGRLVPIEEAIPERSYQGVFNGANTISNDKWGISETYLTPLFSSQSQPGFVTGADGGHLVIKAPGMAIDGTLRGITIRGDQQRSAPPGGSSLDLVFEGEKAVQVPGSAAINYIGFSPDAPQVVFAKPAEPMSLAAPSPASPATVVLRSSLLDEEGFDKLTVRNPEGSIVLPENVSLTTETGGAVTLEAANIDVRGDIISPGGSISLTTYNISPYFAAEWAIVNPPGSQPFPAPNPDRGLLTLAAGASLSSAGLITSDLEGGPLNQPVSLTGGSVSIRSFNAELAADSVIDVSGGVYVSGRSQYSYGNAGAIEIITGTDAGLPGISGGAITLESTLRGFSGAKGGSLSVQADTVYIGGDNPGRALNLDSAFFSRGGFTKYAISAVGRASNNPPPAGLFESYIPAIEIAAGTRIHAVAENMVAVSDPQAANSIRLERRMLPQSQRTPVSLDFRALGTDDPSTLSSLEVRGDLVMQAGAIIRVEPGAAVGMRGQTVTLLGSIMAPAGNVIVSGSSSFPLTAEQRLSVTQALPTVHLGSAARISAAGAAVPQEDPFGRNLAKVLAGGSIQISGNIVAEQGSVLDVSGTSATVDVPLGQLGSGVDTASLGGSGLVSAPLSLAVSPTRVDSVGGSITLAGSQMLLSDATLIGRAGGPSAGGGTLSASSGRFYLPDSRVTGADINLLVRQQGLVIRGNSPVGVGLSLMDGGGNAYGNLGEFSLSRFTAGGFDNLSLGGNFVSSGTVPFGGNVSFDGDVSFDVAGSLRLAAGGIVTANGKVVIHAGYAAIGQGFRPPENPSDTYIPFRQDPAVPASALPVAPTAGSGSFKLAASFIDLGTLSFGNISSAVFNSGTGDIRGNGSVHIAGSLDFSAGNVYPTTGSRFSIFAYDGTASPGRITFRSSGPATAPVLSNGGILEVYASQIRQSGVLSAPGGGIILGWDGKDLDPLDPDLDTPFDSVARGSLAIPVASSVILGKNSITSVSAKTHDGADITTPFGLTPDGRSWVDPSGLNITLGGLRDKSVAVAGNNLQMAAGAVVDLRGGGDLLASRWVPGNGGSVDLLGSPSGDWSPGAEYKAGDLVRHNGSTWSARVGNSGVTPAISRYWTQVAESFAIIPGADFAVAPYNPFNTGSNAGLLEGDPGYVSNSIKAGDRIYIDEGSAVPAGFYTLLPSRYALLSGAYLVTPKSGAGLTSVATADGSRLVSGYRSAGFGTPDEAQAIRTRFEISPAATFKQRAEYQTVTANAFLAELAKDAGGGSTQRLPGDAGYASLHGSGNLRLDGLVLTAATGRGATVDISSSSAIRILGDAEARAAGSVDLMASRLSSWKVDSLLVGGLRRTGADGVTRIETRTHSINVANEGSILGAADVVLVSTSEIEMASGSTIRSTGRSSTEATHLTLTGSGSLVRVSQGDQTRTNRENIVTSNPASLVMGAGVRLEGSSISLDSSNLMAFDPTVRLGAEELSITSGGIDIVISGSATGGSGNLVLGGNSLRSAFASTTLNLSSYGAINFIGSGTLGSTRLEQLNLSAPALRGFGDLGGETRLTASGIRLDNRLAASPVSPAAVSSGTLVLDAEEIVLADHSTVVSGYDTLTLDASERITATGKGSLAIEGNLLARSPLLTGAAGSVHGISSSGSLQLLGTGGPAGSVNSLGANLSLRGSNVKLDSSVILPGGGLDVQATTGNLEVNGLLSVEGGMKRFNELVRYTNAGEIRLSAAAGDVVLFRDATISVAAAGQGGDAGNLSITAAGGRLFSEADLDGSAGSGFTSGSFNLDVGSFSTAGGGSFNTLNQSLDAGRFANSRVIRVRSGDVVLSEQVRASEFVLSADQGSISVTGSIDASGPVGGHISLSASGDLIVASGAKLSVAGRKFNSAGKGGSMLLEAGAQTNGMVDSTALLDLQAGSLIDLHVDEFVAGGITQHGSSAFDGKFTGTLHLRAPRNAANTDLGIASIGSSITGASSIVAEGYKIYQPAGGTLNIAIRNQIHTDNTAFLGANGSPSANDAAVRSRLLGGTPGAADLDPLLVIAPGVEIINPSGDLTLGLANLTGSASLEALAAADWDLSSFRYGSRGAAGVLTMRAAGDLVFNNTLSDGFTPITQGTANNFADNGHSLMWLATLSEMNPNLPANTQSWSFRLTAGADMTSSSFRGVNDPATLDSLLPGKGSVLVGEFHPVVPNRTSTGTGAGIGSDGQTADSIRISSSTTNRGNRFEVIRTGTGDITISAGRDIQLRNQFSTIYTAGVALPDPTGVFGPDDFVIPVVPTAANRHPSQSGGAGLTLGAVQQLYQPVWSIAGGDIDLGAARDIGRFTMVNGTITADSSRQMPTNWLYRRGFVDPATGLFSNQGGFGDNPNIQNSSNVNDTATSTAWWIDYSNFFQGVGALGGGNVTVKGGNDIINLDAVAPTNARMAGRKRNPDFGIVTGAPEFLNLAPDEARLRELGGGDVTIRAGRNIDGGTYYVERGTGSLLAGGDITTNSARTPSQGLLSGEAPLDFRTWLPTTLFVGKSSFDVIARGSVLLGPVSNPFLLPQGINNRYWYKTYFSTFSEGAGVEVAAYGGNVTHRMAVTLPDSATSRSMFDVWFNNQNLFNGAASSTKSSFYQPWIRLAETGLQTFDPVFSLAPPNLRSTSFSGDVELVGDMTLAPSPSGGLEISASGGIKGLNPTGVGQVNNQNVTVWTSATINVSDASPASIPGVLNPSAYQALTGRDRVAAVQSLVDVLEPVRQALAETGSYTGSAAAAVVKQSLHGNSVLHRNNPNPVILGALGGDITGLTLFTPKQTRVTAQRDITDVAFYIQNTGAKDISLVSAGRDIKLFNESSELRTLAENPQSGNRVGDTPKATSNGSFTNAEAGDLQISGPGVLEVIAGRSIDLGTGPNFSDGTGTGITSIGNSRNPNLPFTGADLIVLPGTSAAGGLPAPSLHESTLDFTGFIDRYLSDPAKIDSPYLKKIGEPDGFEDADDEVRAVVALEQFYKIIRNAGRKAGKDGDYSAGFAAIRSLFGTARPEGEIDLRAREIRTVTGGRISLAVPGGSIRMASEIFGNPLVPPGIVTEFGGAISTYTHRDVDIGQARIFTLRGGDIMMWSSQGNIAAGSAPRTVVTAPPTRVVVDVSSASVQTDLGGLATGGGIGVLAAVEGVTPGNVDLIAPNGFVDAGDAGIRVTGNLNIAAQVVLNSANISVSGATTGASITAPAAPSVSTVTAAANTAAATTTAGTQAAEQNSAPPPAPEPEAPSVYTVEVIGYGGAAAEDEEDDEDDSSSTEGTSETPSAP
jgi:filamentous hemagglutinin family protein